MSETMSGMPSRVAGLEQVPKNTSENLRVEMRETRSEMRAELQDIRTEMRQGLRELRGEARSDFKWLLGSMLVGFAVTIAFLFGSVSKGH